MKRLYGAANLPEAYLVLGMLSRAGIPAHVFNENAQGAAGELPVAQACPEIWIDDERDYTLARRVVEDYERRSADDESCWRCGEAL
jgi:hypothetical protein